MIDARTLWRTRRDGLITGAAVGAVVAVVAGIAVTSGGYTAQRVDLGDAAVWVANQQYESVGRANTAIRKLNAVVEAGGTRPEIVQRGATVLVLDRDRASVGILDAANSTVVDTVAVPPADPQLALAGEHVVMSADGDVWVEAVEEFGRFEADAEPDFAFGAESVVSVDEAGRVFGFTPSTGEVALVRTAAPDTEAGTWQLEPIRQAGGVHVTSVDGRWAVLDAAERMLHLEAGTVDLSDLVGEGEDPVLQEPSVAGDAVLVATRERLIEVGLDAAEPRELVGGRSGTPARPIVHGGCVHAAWSVGVAWSRCGDEVDTRDLGRRAAPGALRYLANGDALVLNDRQSGATWTASDGYELIDNWNELRSVERDTRQVEENDPDAEPTIEKSQVPPVAVDDEFGARPGRATLLPVLLNDYDANGDVLVVSAASGDLPEGVRLDVVSDRQQLQLTLDDRAAGSFAIRYDIDDGRGGTAQAVARVTVRAPDENAAPVQVRESRAVVESGGRMTTAVLGEWVDPDGDPMFLRSAATAGPDTATSSADGVVVFDERGGDGARRSVSLLVSDGRADGGGTLTVSVRAPGEAPLVAESFVAIATQGQEIRIEPLRHVRGGSGEAVLTAVPAKPEAELTPDFDQGSFRFSSDAVRTHFLEYTVSDGGRTASGTVRVEVTAPPERETTPITVPHTAFLHLDRPVEVDVLAGDIDPTGGLLVITGPGAEPDDPGVQVEVVEHRMLRVTLTRPLEEGSARFGYRVSNGLADAEGTVTIVQVPPPSQPQPPVAAADTASARTGDVVDIPVLDNDEHPDGEPLELDAELVRQPDAGLLFASGNRLRYQAPDEAGVYEAAYRVAGPDGQNATATVVITVREAAPETNAAPVPATATARVLAGDTVRIPIPLAGTDPDGDSVQLLGQESNPERGSVVARGADWLEYRAGEYSAGTDTFEYSVVDALGARATGSIRVGVAPGLESASAPVAVDDRITVRPGREVAVRVLANDSDPDGGALTIDSVTPNTGDAEARIDGDLIRVEVPAGDADHGFVYTVEDDRLGQASAFLRIDAREDAPLIRPVAADVVLSLSDVLEQERVEVDVLEDVFLADADPRRATVSLVEGYDDDARITSDGTVEVEVQDRRRIIPYAVAHPDDPEIVSLAFIWVPGRDDALPQLRRDAPQVRVTTGEEVVIELADHVVAASGRPVRLTDAATVRASNSDGSDLVVDEDTVRFRSEEGYFGPASISLTVTDGDSADDPDGRTGTIVIPIDVLPDEGQPPTFTGGLIEFEPGQSRTIALERLTTRADDGTEPDLAFRLLGDPPRGFELALEGGELRIRASESVPHGSRAGVAVGVVDGEVEGTPGRIDLRVVPSTRPLAQPAPDTAVAPRGTTTTVDVLANDAPGNPFPGTPLRVISVRGLDAANLPAGVSIAPDASRSRLAVTVSETAAPVNTTVQYQVADATGDRSRYAWGSVTISVQDRPDPVSDARLTGFGDRRLDVAFGAGAANNSPIEAYRITLVDPDSGEVGATECASTTCAVPTPGNGPGAAVTVRIQARNSIGLSDPVEIAGTVWSDVVPPAPSGLRALPLDGRLRIVWDPVPTGSGSPVDTYVVSVAGSPFEVSATRACTATQCATESQRLANGSNVAVAVSARNGALPALAAWTEATASGMPFGAPVAGDIVVDADPSAGAVVVSWTPFDGNGDPVGGYFVQRLVEGESGVPTGAQACSVTAPAPGTVVAPTVGGTVAEVVRAAPGTSSVTFTGTSTESAKYSFLVWGHNRAGCAHTAVASTVVRPAPGSITGIDSAMDWLNGETWDRFVSGVDAGTRRLQIIAVDANGARVGSPRDFSGSGWLRALLNRPFGETARFQVRACSVWGSCGPWSETQPAGDSPSLTFALPGRAYDAATSTWSWTADPANGGLPATYRCGAEGDRAGRLAQSATSCQVAGARPGDTVWLDVEVAGVTARFEAR